MKFTVRRYLRDDDLHAVRLLVNESLRTLSGHLHAAAAFDRHEQYVMSTSFASDLQELSYWVALASNSTVVGCGGWAPDRSLGGARLREVFVHPSVARLGAGSLVVTTAILDAHDAGFDDVWVFSSQYAIPFYTSLGFIARGQLTEDDLPSMPMLLRQEGWLDLRIQLASSSSDEASRRERRGGASRHRGARTPTPGASSVARG